MPAIYDASGYPISILDLDDWDMAERILTNADVVIISVPIDHTLETIERLKPYLTENMLLADLTSVKRAPLAKMLDVHKGAVVGLHPMFAQISRAWQNKWLCVVMGVLVNVMNGC